MEDEERFRDELMSIGIISYSEQEKLLGVARRCLAFGVPIGGAGAAMGAGLGSVAVPVVGSIPGWMAGFLAGLLTGTATCMAINYGLREELRDFAR